MSTPTIVVGRRRPVTLRVVLQSFTLLSPRTRKDDGCDVRTGRGEVAATGVGSVRVEGGPRPTGSEVLRESISGVFLGNRRGTRKSGSLPFCYRVTTT